MAKHLSMMMNKEHIHLLQCPLSGGSLTLSDDGLYLISGKANCRYPIENGIALLLEEQAMPLSSELDGSNSSDQPMQD